MVDTEEVAVALDVGGTWIRGALVDPQGQILWLHREPSHSDDASKSLVVTAEDVARAALAQARTKAVRGIGLALASPMDPVTGTMLRPPNLPELDGVSFNARWRDKLGPPVVSGNDATLAALAEYTYGAGKAARTLIYMTISTGIGAGVILDGEMFLGAYGMAGEVGHMVVELDGPPCRCGGSGCLEAIASGTAIAEEARRRIAQGETSIIPRLVSGGRDRIGAREVFAAAAQGDRLAQEIIHRAGRALGAGIVTILHSFNPDVIVVGGAVSQQWHVLWPIVERYVLENAMEPFRQTLKVVRSSLGDEIGLLGAAALVWRSVTPRTDRP